MTTRSISPLGRAMVTTFGLGLLRPAPGTWGSMPPVLLAGAIFLVADPLAAGWPAWMPWVYHALLALVMVVFSLGCLAWGNEAEATFGKKDPGSVCADETAGMSLTLMAPPLAQLNHWWEVAAYLLLAFLSFRATDILKLPPARGLQHHPAGVGILLDDLVAGVQALIVVQLVSRLAM